MTVDRYPFIVYVRHIILIVPSSDAIFDVGQRVLDLFKLGIDKTSYDVYHVESCRVVPQVKVMKNYYSGLDRSDYYVHARPHFTTSWIATATRATFPVLRSEMLILPEDGMWI